MSTVREGPTLLIPAAAPAQACGSSGPGRRAAPAAMRGPSAGRPLNAARGDVSPSLRPQPSPEAGRLPFAACALPPPQILDAVAHVQIAETGSPTDRRDLQALQTLTCRFAGSARRGRASLARGLASTGSLDPYTGAQARRICALCCFRSPGKFDRRFAGSAPSTPSVHSLCPQGNSTAGPWRPRHERGGRGTGAGTPASSPQYVGERNPSFKAHARPSTGNTRTCENCTWPDTQSRRPQPNSPITDEHQSF